MNAQPDLIEEMEYYLSKKQDVADGFIQLFRSSLGKDKTALQHHQRITQEIQGILDFLEIVFGLEAHLDQYRNYHLTEKEYYQ